MKKTLVITIILLLLMSIGQMSYAAGGDIEVNFTGTTQIAQDAKTVTLTIALGEFTEIPEDATIAYEAVLEYDENIFSAAAIEGINNWTASYEEPNILGETITTGVANTEIAKITLTLKEDAAAGTTTVKLKEGKLSAGSVSQEDFDLDLNFEKEVSITIPEKSKEEENKPEENQVPSGNTVGNTTENTAGNTVANTTENTTGNNTSTPSNLTANNNGDKTAASKILPSTGAGKIALFVVLVLIVGIGCFIRYKSIKIK